MITPYERRRRSSDELRSSDRQRTVIALAQRLGPLSLLAGLAFLGYHLLTSPNFEVKQITVLGNRALSSSQVIEAAAVKGMNIFSVNTQEVRGQVLALGIPQEVRVEARLPDTIIIELTELPPAAVWVTGDKYYNVSEDGLVLGAVLEIDQPLVIIDNDGKPLELGHHVNPDALQVVLQLARDLPRLTPIKPKHFEYTQAQGISVPTDFGYRVLFGSSDSLDMKVSTLGSILNAISASSQQFALIDLRFTNHPYIR
jgi:cell division septal protein FtsQ